MAQSSVFLNARRSQRLLRRQEFRERLAQAALMALQAGQVAAFRGLESARLLYRDTKLQAAETMRNRWDDKAGALLSIDQLTDLRGAERDTDARLDVAERHIADAEQNLADYPARIETASAALARESSQTLRRRRITAHCNRKVATIMTNREERALEDDLIGRQSAAR